MDILILAANILGWSLLSIVLAALITLLVVRVILGVRFSAILAEIEDRQNAAVGVIFKDVAIATSILLLIFTLEGITPSESILGAALWALGGGLLTLIFMLIIGYFILHLLARRKHLRETAIGYLRRELIDEKNQALAHIITALLIVISIAVTSQIM